nr:type I polyketide synthase [Amycolatopsis sp. CA-126428]
MADQDKLLDYLKRVTADLHQTRQRLSEAEAGLPEPIAIVGMSCRFPHGADTPERLWDLLSGGVDVMSEFPADRGWDLDSLYDPDPEKPGTSYVAEGGFLDAAGEFDPAFFGISPREALAMDPQQRLLLETSWEAIERGGLDPASLRGGQVGVFAGTNGQDYGGLAALAPGTEAYLGTGSSASVLSGRIAYALGLEGPTLTVDTACSSSLVSVHLAAQALRAGECRLALAGGVTVMATPGAFVAFSRQRGLAADGRCKAFSDRADGVGWSEGAGMLLLERLSDARRNGHPVLAVVRGSAINSDGASNGLTAPNGPSQQRVIRQALADAGLSPSDVDAVEAHGTGTSLGDPIEAQALLATYGKDRDRPLWLGSVKSNLGHTQAAAGVAGVLKVVLALQHRELPKTLHVDRPSSRVDWTAGDVRLLTEPQPWTGDTRRAGVSAFGVSGTNAHLIIEEAPRTDETAPEPAEVHAPTPWPLSGRTEAALRDQARRLRERLRAAPEPAPVDVAYSLASSRSAFEHRAVLLADDVETALRGLDALATGERASGVLTGVAAEGRTAFLFSGQGAQRTGMAAGLAAAFPAFAEELGRVCAELDRHLDRPLRELLDAGADVLDRTEYTQPALFAVEVALYRFLGRWGLAPDLVAGHSIGELAAAHVAGVLSLEDAAVLVAARGRLMQRLPAGGAMVAVAATEAEVVPLLTAGVELAAINGPASVVLSGDEPAVLDVAAQFDRQGRKTRRLRVSHAFHSPRMEPMLAEYAAVADGLSYRDPSITVVSTVTGEAAKPGELSTAEYWVRQVRREVRFHDAVRALRELGATRFVELGPDAVLTPMVEESLAGDSGEEVVIPVLRRDRDEAEALTTAVGVLHGAGVSPDWAAVFAGRGARRADLPTYPFQRSRYWPDVVLPGGSDGMRYAGLSGASHPLLGAVVGLAGAGGAVFTGRLSTRTQPWLADHVVAGTILVPGTAFLELAVRAGDEFGCACVEELTLAVPLALPERGGVRLQVVVGDADDSGARAISVHSQREDEGAEAPWTLHATGVLGTGAPAGTDQDTTAFRGFRVAEPPARGEAPDLTVWPPDGASPVDLTDAYAKLAAAGLAYGPVFQGLTAVWRLGDELFAEVALPGDATGEAARFGLHPALLDAGLHALGVGSGAALPGAASGTTVLPFSWTGVVLHATGAASLRVRLSPAATEDAVVLHVTDPAGAPVLTVESLTLRAAPADPGTAGATESLFELAWPEVPAGAKAGWTDLAGSELAALAARIDDGATVPEHVLVSLVARGGLPERAHALAGQALGLVQAWLADARFAASRLVFRTRGAVAAGAGSDVTDPAAATVWGLVRSAQAENPGRFVLLDTDGSEDSGDAVLAAALGSGEPQLAVRSGVLRAPRFARAAPAPDSIVDWGDGTVLLTGGTGALGGIFARHLVTAHGVRRLLLAARRGLAADGAAELVAELTGLGCHTEVVACDVADPDALAELLAGLPASARLSSVVHLAGVLDDGIIESLTPDRLGTVLRPKVDAAWQLHELTREADLRQFVVFSSISGVVGAAGQGNYAAANAFLDALMAQRAAMGLPGRSLAWGLWDEAGAMTGGLDEADRSRIARGGVLPLSADEGRALFDAALSTPGALHVPMRLDLPALRGIGEALAPIWRTLVPAVRRRSAGAAAPRGSATALGERLAELAPDKRQDAVVELVRAQAAAVLGHPDGTGVDPGRAFRELGFDSLTALELRNGLAAATGLRLPATLIFDYPNSAVLAEHLLERVFGPGEARAGTRTVRRSGDEPIAIIGMSCRYPGGVRNPDDLWSLVEAGGDGISPMPLDRGWNLEALFAGDPDQAGSSYVREGGFLHDAAEFDAAFFSISPREALAMDPQQRLLLEGCWEAVESAGIDPTSLKGSETGVYTGVMYHDYGAQLFMLPDGAEGYVGTGTSGSVASGRVSYVLGLEGPAVTIDTACSSSLVTLHLAAQALRRGECSLALAGGVTVMSTPSTFIDYSRQRALSASGRSKSFAASADGTGWGEGLGMLLVARLSDAIEAGYPVLAIVRGTAVNQDGASNGLTAPNGPSQQRVIRRALADADLDGAEVDVVEAHGTGTRLGDPIEAQALLATYGQDHPDDRPLWLGSVKSNLGHTQAAAGAAGVIKMILAMRHGLLPKTMHVDAPTPQVDWSAGNVRLLTEPVPWERNGRPRRAAVSSFGISGTNAHVILEEPEPGEPAAREPRTGPALPWVLSAKTADSLRGQAARLLSYVDEHGQVDLADVGFTLATRRAAFQHRAAVTAGDVAGFRAGLAALADGTVASNLVRAEAGPAGKTAFVFPGQGAQWAGMGAELLDASPVFAERISECALAFAGLVDWSLVDVLRGEPGAPSLERVDVVQPVSFAVMVSLAALWRAAGVEPDAVAGHSQGEIAAACVAGALSLEDAATIVVRRSQAIEAGLSGHGGMASVGLPEEEARRRIARWEPRVSVAVVNGPSAVVVAGERDAIDELVAVLDADGVRAKRIAVDYASHSAHVERIESVLAEVLAGVRPREGAIPMLSSVTGDWIGGAELDAAYWYTNLREPVRFATSVRGLADAGYTAFVEVSPHPVLSTAIQETLADAGRGGAVTGTLRRDDGGLGRFHTSLAEWHTHGGAVRWQRFFAPYDARPVELPTYAFRAERFWPKAPDFGGDPVSLGLAAAKHPLLGAGVSLAGSEAHLFTGRLSANTQSWLADHVVAGTNLVPATVFVELAIRAGDEAGCDTVDELVLEAPLVLPARGGVALQVRVEPADGTGRRPVTVHSRPDGAPDEQPWTRHVSGLLAAGATAAPAGPFGGEWPPAGAEPIPLDGFYGDDGFYDYGPAFRGLRAAWRHGDEVFAEVVLPEGGEADRYGLHPALLDAALHTLGLGVVRLGEDGAAVFPFSWSGVTLHAAGASVLRVRVASAGTGSVAIDAADEAGAPVLTVGSLAFRPMPADAIAAASAVHHESLFRLEWAPAAVADAADDGIWVVLGDDEPALRDRLDEAGRGRRTIESYPDVHALGEVVESGVAGVRTVVLPVVTGTTAEAVRAAANRALAVLQDWLADDRLAATRLVVVTSGAVTTAGEAVTNLAGAAVWGLVRTAQWENPGRIVLIDHDDDPASLAALPAAASAGEPQLAVRAGVPSVARLARVVAAGTEPAKWDPEGTVLIVGGTGTLGRSVARHLVTERGARRLLLTSRRGAEADGVAETVGELTELGAEVTVAACDATDRDSLRAVLTGIPEAHPLTAVLHVAVVMDDATIGSLTPERMDTVLRSKVDVALNLHELTGDRELAAFVLFSSVAGVLGLPGQGNYAAANAFLDALAHHRHSLGLPALALDWGLWARSVEAGRTPEQVGQARVGGGAVAPLPTEKGLRLLDVALASGEPVLAPVALDLAALRTQGELLPKVFRSLAPVTRRVAGAAAETDSRELVARLAALPPADRVDETVRLVRSYAAAVLGFPGPDAIEPDRGLAELGFDSLTSVELRNGLAAATGLRLPASLVFDHPVPTDLAEFLLEQLADALGTVAPPAGGNPAGAAAAPDDDGETLSDLFRLGIEQGKERETWEILRAVSKLRSTFSAVAEATRIPKAVTLSRGPSPAKLIAFSSYAGLGGVHQYARMAAAFRGTHELHAFPNPGFAKGESLPISIEAAAAVLGEATLPHVEDGDFVLFGHSAGGLMAHATACYLERLGVRPAAIVMMDSFRPDDSAALGVSGPEMMAGLLSREDIAGRMDSTRLTSMDWYFRISGEWTPGEPAAPILFLRAADPMGETEPDPDGGKPWQPTWKEAHTVLEVPGDHFTMVESLAAGTAEVMRTWLAEHLPAELTVTGISPAERTTAR